MKYIVGNWKSHKSLHEAQNWIQAFSSYNLSEYEGKLRIIICPSFPLISLMKDAFQDSSLIYIGAEDISAEPSGTHTGEVSGEILHGLAEYVLIGHSERRSEHDETNQIVADKVQQALFNDIQPIVLVRSPQDTIPDGVVFVAYEPVDAIGTGHAQDISQVVEMKKQLNLPIGTRYLYGGSVHSGNVNTYMSHPDIDGIVPGKASLDPHEFYELIRNSF